MPLLPFEPLLSIILEKRVPIFFFSQEKCTREVLTDLPLNALRTDRYSPAFYGALGVGGELFSGTQAVLSKCHTLLLNVDIVTVIA